MSHKTLEQCHSGKDFIDYAKTHGANVRNGNGSHFMVTTAKGGVCVPYHANNDLGTGLRHKIIKAFISIGILVLLVGIMLQTGII